VWTVLYIFMGIALWQVWISKQPYQVIQKAIIVFAIQLTLNFWWSFLFFSLQSPLIALIDICILLGLIVYLIKLFRQIAPQTTWLLTPYFLWVSFATLLNTAIWWLN
jgi:translocator protein